MKKLMTTVVMVVAMASPAVAGCIGPVIMNKCHGVVTPFSDGTGISRNGTFLPDCIGPVIMGKCHGTSRRGNNGFSNSGGIMLDLGGGITMDPINGTMLLDIGGGLFQKIN